MAIHDNLFLTRLPWIIAQTAVARHDKPQPGLRGRRLGFRLMRCGAVLYQRSWLLTLDWRLGPAKFFAFG